MIKSRDLRIGNWVESPSESKVRFQIQEIEYKQLHFNPVRLRHEMIAKWRRDYIHLPFWFDFKQFQLDPNFWVWVGVSNRQDRKEWNGCCLGIRLEYVHQLQNLYHTLHFNQELEIDLNFINKES